ncbi:hypothetical protein CBR_g48506 [Chara braunii]|uniref:Reverse transcriptase domain-containing protein n=1 Tax=Chara braunii TaxID=69332 RepID=A0A388M2V5_CHABU|nr:hypothetical protein CBR_g48506 [Chara braunii]|eukprot:GBG88894.1 hypothetical protein CBR_g48506 [Chara braunii]
MNKEDFSTIGAFVHEFKKKARKVHGISEEAQCATFLELLTGSEAAELTKHGEGSEKLTWATIDKGVEGGSLDQVEQHQMRLQRCKRKERDATASGTPGVKRIVSDVLAALGYDNEEEIQKRGVTVAQGRASGAVDEEAGREDKGGEETGSQALTKAQRKQLNLLLGGQGSGKGQEEEDGGDDEEDERLRQEEDRRAEQRAKKRGIQGEAEPSLGDGAPKRKKYAVWMEEGFDVERMVDKHLESHNDLMNLRDILASAPRLSGELKGRLSRRHEGTMILALSDPACGNYEIIKCRNTGPRSGRNRLNLGSFTFEESEYARRRLREEQEEGGAGEVLSLSLNDVNKAMEVVAAHDMADPEAIKALREQAGPCRINDENEEGLITGESGSLSPQERTLMVETMKRRHCVYAFNDDERGSLDVDKILMIRIHTVPHEPWNLRGARYPNPDEEKKVVDYLDGKMWTYVADYSSGPYASPWFCFIKPNGTLRSITVEETRQTLKYMAKGKSPGVDGLTVEFYMANWETLGRSLVEVYNEVLTDARLGKGMTHNIISVMFKKGDKAEVRNWQPISLLNVSYKILAKTLARRIARYLPSLIEKDQGAFVQGRSIFNNIVTAIETLEIVQREGLDMGVLIPLPGEDLR